MKLRRPTRPDVIIPLTPQRPHNRVSVTYAFLLGAAFVCVVVAIKMC